MPAAPHRTTTRRLLALVAALALLLAACSSDADDASDGGGGGGSGTTEAPSTAPAASDLTVLVTNDDGVGAPGIDALVEALRGVDGVEVVVVAPAENQSGSSDTTSEGEVTWEEATTASGYPAVAVAGFPADAVGVALDELGIEPDLVVSGSNEGQNIGPFVELSGTVGAARTAARRGIPALAVSQAIGDPADFAVSVDEAVAWLEANLDAAGAGELPTDVIVSINGPTCATGEVKGVLEVPVAADLGDRDPFTVDCEAEPATEPTDDVGALIVGWITVSEVPAG